MGRGQKYEGLFIGKKAVPSKYRIRDRFIEFCRKYLQGGIVHKVETKLNDRLLNIHFTKRDCHYDFTCFWKGRELYFSLLENNKEGKRVFCSWIGWQNIYDETTVESIYSKIGAGNVKSEKEAKGLFDEENYFHDLEKNVDVHSFPKRKKKFFQRKLVNIEKDLEKVKKWKELKHEIEGSDFVIPMDYEFSLQGLKFKIDVSVNEFKRRDKIYKKIKAFRNAETLLENRLNTTRNEFKKWADGDVFIVKGLGKTVEPVWKSTKKSDRIDQVKGVNKKIYSIGSELQLAVGLDSSSNDWLRKNWASKEDIWFHIDGDKSAHVFLKNPKNVNVEHNLLQLIGSVMKAYSQFSSSQIPLVYTQVKNVKGVKGAPGKVTFKKEKRIDVYFDESWKERISIIS
ncbi:hypothetical protein A9Q84_21295 [Halobacteriovorax marinus]|uniref:NFACT RNA-binding domain-containing protein n=1 Tax=Halobacteriovorax marinus TaxID=97084 RepID=A0A1Y5F5K8_9BACT|nr:hypothetical protein A9Q84_21295 [Halobacteriovorax marinus]